MQKPRNGKLHQQVWRGHDKSALPLGQKWCLVLALIAGCGTGARKFESSRAPQGVKTLNIVVAGTGHVVVSSGGRKLRECHASCVVKSKHRLSISAIGTFVGWSGDCRGAGRCVLNGGEVTASFSTQVPKVLMEKSEVPCHTLGAIELGDGTVFYGMSALFEGSSETEIGSINADTGEPIWTQEIGGTGAKIVLDLASSSEGRQLVAALQGSRGILLPGAKLDPDFANRELGMQEVVAFDADSGAIKWIHSPQGGVGAVVAVRGGFAFWEHGNGVGNLVQVDFSGKETKNSEAAFALNEIVRGMVLLGPERFLVASSSLDGSANRVWLFDASNNRVVSERVVPGSEGAFILRLESVGATGMTIDSQSSRSIVVVKGDEIVLEGLGDAKADSLVSTLLEGKKHVSFMTKPEGLATLVGSVAVLDHEGREQELLEVWSSENGSVLPYVARVDSRGHLFIAASYSGTVKIGGSTLKSDDCSQAVLLRVPRDTP